MLVTRAGVLLIWWLVTMREFLRSNGGFKCGYEVGVLVVARACVGLPSGAPDVEKPSLGSTMAQTGVLVHAPAGRKEHRTDGEHGCKWTTR